METRVLLSIATINVGTTIRAVPSNLLGINTAPWDGVLTPDQDPNTLPLSQAAGFNAVRIGGGEYIDGTSTDNQGWHFDVNDQATSLPEQLAYITGLNATGMIDMNYGTASWEEDAAELAYLNAPINNPTIDNVVIGPAPAFDGNAGAGNGTVTGGWGAAGGVSVDGGANSWQTVGFWASLRAATPLPVDDGLNFLRLGQAAPFGFHYFEIGNEIYGSTWEADAQGVSPSDISSFMPTGKTPKAHDPTTIVAFCKQFQILADQIDPTIAIGIDSQAVNNSFNNWIANVLSQCVSQGVVLGFIADHYYPQSAGSESDANLLAVSTTASNGNTYDWSQRAAAYDTLIHNAAVAGGAAGVAALGHTQLVADELNSVSGSPGKQTVSLVNGLFLADSLGSVLYATGNNTLGGYQGVWVWDLHNGNGGGNKAATLYGWRTKGDFGIIGNGLTGTALDELSPSYFAMQLASKIIQVGGTVVSASEDNQSSIDTFSVLEPDGHLDILVVNKTMTGLNTDTTGTPALLSETFNINGFSPADQAQVWQFGSAQDNLQEANGFTFNPSLADSMQSLNVSNGSFSFGFPSYSMTVLDIAPNAPTIATPAAAAPNPVVGTSTNLTVLGQEGGSDSGLTYTWAATGPASVIYSDNGTNTAKSTIATFSGAGSYVFTVTITDTSSQTITSSVNVVVNATLAGITVSPGTPTVADGQTQGFSASAFDQFGNPISTAFTWSVDDGGVGSVDGTGLYSAPAGGPGSATVRATSGSVSGTASVGINFTTIAGTTGNDNILLTSNGSVLEVYMGGSLAYSASLYSFGPLTVEGLAGDDTITIDFSGGTVAPAGLSVDGGDGDDSLIILGTPNADTASVNTYSITFDGALINYSNIESIAINSGAGADSLAQTAQPSAALTFSPTDTDASLYVDAGTFNIPASSGGIQPVYFFTLSVDYGAAIILAGPPDPNNHTVLVVNNYASPGLLDLGANDLILKGQGMTGLDEISTFLATGANKGLGYWNGSNGILSSTAAHDSTFLTTLGVMENTTGNPFDGQPSAVGDTLVKYTYYGDADLNGTLNGADYQQIDNGFGEHLTGWSNGDFNYDGVIDGSDYSLLDNTFNQLIASGASPLAAIAATPPVLPKDAARPASAAAASAVQNSPAAVNDPAELKKHQRSVWSQLDEENTNLI